MRKEDVNSSCDGICAIGFQDVGTIFAAHVACESSVLELEFIIGVYNSRIIVADSEPSLEALEDRAIRA